MQNKCASYKNKALQKWLKNLQSQIKSKCEERLITQIVYSVRILSKGAYVAQTKRK